MSASVDPTLRALNNCGCCAGVTVETRAVVANRPGLPAISYRVGTQPLFKASLLARLSASGLPALRGLKTRADDDFSIALLDAWATTADVLTFYQERIANESYLRTATERLSVLQLARLIGYELNPGVAASVDLAFTVQAAQVPGVPAVINIPIGTKVQSIPGPGQTPQTFETIGAIQACAAWNAFEPQSVQVVQPAPGDRQACLAGLATNLKEGDGILFVGSDREKSINSQLWDFRQVTKVEPDPSAGFTRVFWSEPLGSAYTPPAPDAKVFAFRKRAALFGSNAPDVRTLPDSILLNYGLSTGNVISAANATVYATLHGQGVSDGITAQALGALDSTLAKYGLTEAGSAARATEWSFKLTNPINLDASYPTITPSVTATDGSAMDSWIVLALPGMHHLYKVTATAESAPNNYTLTTKTTQLTLDNANFLPNFLGGLRNVAVFAQSDLLELAQVPITTPLQGGTIVLAQAVSGLQKGQRLIVTGLPPGAATGTTPVSETAFVFQLSSDGLTITLQQALLNVYDPATVSICANVAPATHGESKREVLGSGDGSQTYLQFTLSQSPLTYISSTGASGGQSTLDVSVNDLSWQEVPTLYGHGPHERIFITRLADDGTTTVEFGDGVTGGRVPTGQENVTATYRKGIGTAGNLNAGQLSLLMTRPLGVSGVVNPEPATGAADPEVLADARANAPITVLTLDRIVSLQDYEDFARAFSGIAKALATWTWTGQVRGVFVTVAGSNGAAVPAGFATHDNLVTAMLAAGDPYIPLLVQTYRPAFFKLGAAVKLDPAYDPDAVAAAIEQALRAAFSFAARAFGQAVALSEVVAVIQSVAGVIAVNITRLYRTDDPAGPGRNDVLLAAVPQAGAGGSAGSGSVAAAELLTLSTDPLDELGALP